MVAFQNFLQMCFRKERLYLIFISVKERENKEGLFSLMHRILLFDVEVTDRQTDKDENETDSKSYCIMPIDSSLILLTN